MVGGRVFNENPDIWKITGADGWAPDAKKAVELARGWWIERYQLRDEAIANTRPKAMPGFYPSSHEHGKNVPSGINMHYCNLDKILRF